MVLLHVLFDCHKNRPDDPTVTGRVEEIAFFFKCPNSTVESGCTPEYMGKQKVVD